MLEIPKDSSTLMVTILNSRFKESTSDHEIPRGCILQWIISRKPNNLFGFLRDYT
jgi:hypothetical protein